MPEDNSTAPVPTDATASSTTTTASDGPVDMPADLPADDATTTSSVVVDPTAPDAEDEQREHDFSKALPHLARLLPVGVLGHIARDEDEERHVKDIDESHHAVIDETEVIKCNNEMPQDDQNDQQPLHRIDSIISCHVSALLL